MVSTGKSSIIAPGEVRPGHITFAPFRIYLIPPLSICILGNKQGYLCNNLRVGATYLSFSKKTTSFSQQINFKLIPLHKL